MVFKWKSGIRLPLGFGFLPWQVGCHSLWGMQAESGRDTARIPQRTAG